MTEGRRGAFIAIGFACTALATSLAAVVTLIVRDPAPAPAPAPVVAAAPVEPVASIVDVDVRAADVLELKSRDHLTRAGGDGVRVRTDSLRTALKLQPDDVITSLGGRAVKREHEMYDAMTALALMETTTVYVDVLRDGKPLLLRWKVDKDLRTARREQQPSGSSVGGLFGGGSTGGYGLGGLGTGSSNPYLDPPDVAVLAATVKKRADDRYEMPRDTFTKMFATTSRYARMVPMMRGGAYRGVKLYAIRASSPLAVAGLANGDTILSIGGTTITGMDHFAELVEDAKAGTQTALEIERRGATLVIHVDLK